jgi:ankyrin repeat protein
MDILRSHQILTNQFIYATGVNINNTGKSGFTPLGWAVQNGNLSVVKALLSMRCEPPDTNQSKNQGYYVYQFDENENNDGSTSAAAPPPPDEPRTPDGMESLEWDKEQLDEEQQQVLQDAEQSWVSLYKWYASILERTGHVLPQEPIVENIDVNATDVYCRTALHYAAELGNEEIIRELLGAGDFLASATI